MEKEEHRLDDRGKTLRGYHETLAEKMDISKGVIWLADAREAGAGDFSPPVLPSRDVGRAAGGSGAPHPCSGYLDGWTACQAACRTLIPFSVGSGNPAAHESCEILPCVGTGFP